MVEVDETEVDPSSPDGNPSGSVSESLPNATILDVGHGNSAVLKSGHETVVIDAAPGPTLLDELERTATAAVEHLVLSHADSDHIGGAAAILSGHIPVGTVWYNSDGVKDSETFRDLRALTYQLHKAGQLKVRTQLDNTLENELSSGEMTVRVLHPTLMTSSTGPRPVDHRFGEVTANQMSAVMHVLFNGVGEVLLPGDLDYAGLSELLSGGCDMSSKVLVYPHHGGRSGGDDVEFARKIMTAASPGIVVFSMGRGRYANPRQDVVSAIVHEWPDVRIACTQLSRACAAGLSVGERMHLAPLPAAGRSTSSCCAGSIKLGFGADRSLSPSASDHESFIDDHAPTAMCKKRDSMV